MKKEILLFLILLSSIIYAAKVDDSIYSALNNEDKIKVIIHLNEKENKSPFTVAQETASELNINKKRSFSVIPGFTAEITQEEFESLKNNKNVKAIYLDKKYKLTLQDSVPLINATEVTKRLINNLNITGKSKTVCILDTGINYTHESFGSCSTTDFVNGNCPKVLTGYDYINSDNDPYDLHGHGTHVAGIIGANGVVRGVAPEVNLISIKVCNDAGDCDGSAISSGLDFCIQNATAYNISAISISIGSTTLYSSYCDSSSSFTSFINDAVGKNITVVVATGNDGSTTGIADPSCVKNSTAVSSTTKTDSISSFSNRNSLVDFFAPGSSIYSTYYNGKYATFSGTSMATPHVSGVVALLQSYKQLESNKTLTQPEVESALANSWKTITVNSLNIPRVDALYSLFYIDNKKPIINLDIVNASLFNSTNVILNYSVSDTNLDSCFYNLNGENNISLSSCQNTTITLSNLSNTLTLYANDSKGNLNFSQINIFLSTTTSELLSPLNNINSSSNDIQFSCRGTTNQPYSLNNITLFHNISQEFSANETDTSINGAFLATPSFNLYDIPDGTYIWNCLVRSNSTINNETFAPTNLTITIDTKKPIINSISSSPSTSEATITFTTSESANSTLHYGTTTDTSSNSVSLNKVTSHSFTLSSLSSSTTYYYNITSCDYAGNCNTSSQSTFNTTTSQTTTSSTSTSGGGGGGGGGNSEEKEVETKVEEVVKPLQTIEEPKTNFDINNGIIDNIQLDSDGANDVKVTLLEIIDNSIKPEQQVYKFMEIEAKDPSRVKSAKIQFSIEKSWLRENNILENEVVMLRFHNGIWEELKTDKLSEENSVLKYTAETPGFSLFAISTKKINEVVIETQEKMSDLKISILITIILMFFSAVSTLIMKKLEF